MDFFFQRSSLLASGLAIVWWLQKYLRQRAANPNRLPLPPGPKGYPIIGNLLEFPTVKPWLVYDKWFKTYGELHGVLKNYLFSLTASQGISSI